MMNVELEMDEMDEDWQAQPIKPKVPGFNKPWYLYSPDEVKAYDVARKAMEAQAAKV